MENNNFILKVSRLFPSSCNARTLPDVAKRSITVHPKTNKNSHVQNDILFSNFFKKPEIKNPKKCKRYQLLCNHSDTEGRKCPPVTPISNLNPNNKGTTNNSSTFSVINQSSNSSNSWCTWFSSSDEKSRPDSLSSLSADSFRLKNSRRFKICEELKSIDEIEPQAKNSSNKITCEEFFNKKCQDYELGYDKILTQIYYSKSSDLKEQSTYRRRRRNRRKIKKGSKSAVTIEESYAVQKSSRDPHGDFRASMVEMIAEKNMFGAEDLKRLLHCFLSLNSVSYHGIIVDVFSEICETLFTN